MFKNIFDTKDNEIKESSRNVEKIKKELKVLITYTGRYEFVKEFHEFYSSGVIVKDKQHNTYKIEISEI